MKKIYLITPIIILLVIAGFLLIGRLFKSATPNLTASAQLAAKENNQTVLFPTKVVFLGEKGESVSLESAEIRLKTSIFDDKKAHFYNVKMPDLLAGGTDGKTIYFFVVKDKNGVYRAAANACAVCFKTYKGFRQEGDEIVCNNCGNRYPIEKIATEKGGCNPGPISPNLEVENEEIIIKKADLEQVLNLF